MNMDALRARERQTHQLERLVNGPEPRLVLAHRLGAEHLGLADAGEDAPRALAVRLVLEVELSLVLAAHEARVGPKVAREGVGGREVVLLLVAVDGCSGRISVVVGGGCAWCGGGGRSGGLLVAVVEEEGCALELVAELLAGLVGASRGAGLGLCSLAGELVPVAGALGGGGRGFGRLDVEQGEEAS